MSQLEPTLSEPRIGVVTPHHIIDAGNSTRDTADDSQKIATSDSDSDDKQNLDRRPGSKSSGSAGAEFLGSGHFDPFQRKLYVGLHAFSLSTALVGLILLCVWIFKYKTGVSFTDTKRMGNLHALFMYTFMVGLNAYGVLVYRTFYSSAKEKMKWIHAGLSLFNVIMAIAGVTFMFVSHNASGDPNLYSLHSWIGLTTTVLYASQFLFGLITFLKPGLSQVIRAKSMPLHRFMGAAILVMAGLAAITGIAEWAIWSIKDYNKFSPMTFIANFTGICVLVSTFISVYLLSQRRYRRPEASQREHLAQLSKFAPE